MKKGLTEVLKKVLDFYSVVGELLTWDVFTFDFAKSYIRDVS